MRYVFNGECLFDEKGNDVTEEFYGSYHPSYDAVKSVEEIKHVFVELGFMTDADEIQDQRYDVVWVLRNYNDDPVGLYYPENSKTKTYAMAEFISDYSDIPAQTLAEFIGDPKIKSVSTMMNSNWLESNVETGFKATRLLDYVKVIPDAESIEVFLTLAQTAARLRVTTKTIQNWVQKGKLTPTIKGNKWYFSKAVIDAIK